MKDVHLHRFHAIDVALQNIQRDEVPADVDHQAAPRKSRLIVNGHRGHGESFRARPAPVAEKSARPCRTPRRVGAVSVAPSARTSRTYRLRPRRVPERPCWRGLCESVSVAFAAAPAFAEIQAIPVCRDSCCTKRCTAAIQPRLRDAPSSATRKRGVDAQSCRCPVCTSAGIGIRFSAVGDRCARWRARHARTIRAPKLNIADPDHCLA